MVAERNTIDITDVPEVVRLVEEVRRDGSARVLQRDGEDVAILTPIEGAEASRPTPTYTEEDDEAFLSSFGSWADVDTDKLIEEIYEGRRSSKPPVEL
jgi:hypothetical protein